MNHRHPEKYVCSLFPFSTIGNGKYTGGCEDSAISLFRGARVGEAMLALYRTFKEKKYLNYARHLGKVFARLQKDDGSWPYRTPKQAKSRKNTPPARLPRHGSLKILTARFPPASSRQ